VTVTGCERHPRAAFHRGLCAACLVEDAFGPVPDRPPQSVARFTIQVPLGVTDASSVFLATGEWPWRRLLRLKTWRRQAPEDFARRFAALQTALERVHDETIVMPLAAVLLAVATPVARAEVKTISERKSGGDASAAFKFKDVPAPSKTDAATGLKFTLVDGRRDVPQPRRQGRVRRLPPRRHDARRGAPSPPRRGDRHRAAGSGAFAGAGILVGRLEQPPVVEVADAEPPDGHVFTLSAKSRPAQGRRVEHAASANCSVFLLAGVPLWLDAAVHEPGRATAASRPTR